MEKSTALSDIGLTSKEQFEKRVFVRETKKILKKRFCPDNNDFEFLIKMH